MRGLHKLTNAANKQQAYADYWRLFRLAQANDLEWGTVPRVRDNASARTLDAAAKTGAENILRQRPDLREQIRAIYPGFVN